MADAVLTSSARATGALLDDLRETRRGAPALPGLEPGSYARDHAAFEELSDQRALIGDHLAAQLARIGTGPVSVLSVGCGDGSLDHRLAAGLLQAVPGRRVRYVGVDPWAGSAALFATRMTALADLDPDTGVRTDLSTEVHVAAFADAPVAETFDVVVFVHSLYYVPDVATTLRATFDLLRPGGELWVVNAPRADLNVLVDVLAPPLAGHRQWFSADVADGFVEAGIELDDTSTLDGLVDLAAAGDGALDFAVQARLTPALRPQVRAYLDAVSVAGADGAPRVPHPVVVFRAVRPRRRA